MKFPFAEKWARPKSNTLETLTTWPDLNQIKKLFQAVEGKFANSLNVQISCSFPADSPVIPVTVFQEEFNNQTGELRGTFGFAAVPRKLFQNDPSNLAVGDERQLQQLEQKQQRQQQQILSTPAAQQRQLHPEQEDVLAVQEVGTELLEIQNYILSLIKRLENLLDCSKTLEENCQTAIAGNSVPRLDDDILNAVRELKQELLEVEAKIDLELLHYATQCDPMVPHSILTENKEKIEKLLNVLNASSIRNYLAAAQQQHPCDILAQILGLRAEVLRRIFEGRSSDAAMHENETEVILNYLKDVCRYMSVSQADSAEKVLTEIGFTDNRAKYLAEQIRSMQLGGKHYTIPDLALRFVQDLFQNDLLLTNKTPLYPDKSQATEYKANGFVKRPNVVKPVKCFNLQDDKNLEKNLKTIFTDSEKGLEKPGDFQYWYHGTNNKSASNILDIGIRNKQGRAKKDFSHESGFYLSDDYTAAAEWAVDRSKMLDSCRAVLQYKVKKDFWKQHDTGLELTSNNKKEVEKWRNVIRYFRSEETHVRDENLIKKLDKVPFIKGPMSKDGSWEDNMYKNDWPDLKAVDWSQLCLCRDEVSSKFNAYLDKVVFIVKPKTEIATCNAQLTRQQRESERVLNGDVAANGQRRQGNEPDEDGFVVVGKSKK